MEAIQIGGREFNAEGTESAEFAEKSGERASAEVNRERGVCIGEGGSNGQGWDAYVVRSNF